MGKFLGTYMQTCIIKILGNNFKQQWQHPITKKADAEPKKSRSNKKSRCRNSLLKNGPTKLPCFLKILVSWGDFFDNGLLLCPVQDHTMQCCTRKPFWVAKLEPQSCSASAFPYFEADAELGVHLVVNMWKGSNMFAKWEPAGQLLQLREWRSVSYTHLTLPTT